MACTADGQRNGDDEHSANRRQWIQVVGQPYTADELRGQPEREARPDHSPYGHPLTVAPGFRVGRADPTKSAEAVPSSRVA